MPSKAMKAVAWRTSIMLVLLSMLTRVEVAGLELGGCGRKRRRHQSEVFTLTLRVFFFFA